MKKLTYKIIISKIIKWNFTNAPTIFTRKKQERKFTENFIWMLPLIDIKNQQLEIYLAIQKDPRNFKTDHLLKHKLATITFKQQRFIYNIDPQITKFLEIYKEPTYDQCEKFEIQKTNFNDAFLNQTKKLYELINELYKTYDTRYITKPITQVSKLIYKFQLQEQYGESKIKIRIDNDLENQYNTPKNKQYLPLFSLFNNYTLPSMKPWITESENDITENGLITLKRYSYLTSEPNDQIIKKIKTEQHTSLIKNLKRKQKNKPASELQITTIKKIFDDTYNKEYWFENGSLPKKITKKDANQLLKNILNRDKIGITIKQHYFLEQYFDEKNLKKMTKQTAFKIIKKICEDENQ